MPIEAASYVREGGDVATALPTIIGKEWVGLAVNRTDAEKLVRCASSLFTVN